MIPIASFATRKYAVFISYRHADNKEMGRKWANWLHEALESYEVPPDLIGTTNQRGDQVPASLYPVFRDKEELPADADLSTNIRRALENSGLLVVLCSPRAVQSRFVAEEIRYFKELGHSHRILALIIDGEPNASDDPNKREAFGPDAECFPEPLRFGVAAEDDRRCIDWAARTEPIAADVRPAGRPEEGWTTTAAYHEQLEKAGNLSPKQIKNTVREYGERLELAKLKIVAGALGLPLGVLSQRDKAQQIAKARRRAKVLRRWLIAVGGLSAVAIVLGCMAWAKQQEATANEAQARTALTAETRALALSHYAKAVELIEADKNREASAYVAKAHRLIPDDPVCWSMMFSLLTQTPPALPLGRPMQAGGALDARPMLSHDGSHLIMQTGFSVSIFDVRSGELRYRAGGSQGYWGGCFAMEGPGTMVSSKDGFGFSFYPTVPGLSEPQPFFQGVGEKANQLPLLGNRMRFGRDMKSFILTAGGMAADGIGLIGGQNGFSQALPGLVLARDGSYTNMLALGPSPQLVGVASPRADLVAFGSKNGDFSLWNYTNNEKLITDKYEGKVTSLGFTHEGSRVLVSSWDHHLRGYDSRSKTKIFETDFKEGLNDLDLAADDTVVLVGDYTGVQLMNPATGAEMSSKIKLPSGATAVSLDPTGRRAAVGADDGALWAVEFTGGNGQRRRLTILQDKPEYVALEHSGETALAITSNGLAQRWPVQSWDFNIQQIIPVEGTVDSVRFSPDGRTLLAVSTDKQQVVNVHWIDLSGDEPQVVDAALMPGRKVVATSCLPDGTWFITCSTAEVYRAAPNGLLLELTLLPSGKDAGSLIMGSAAFAPDARSVFLPCISVSGVMNAMQGVSDETMFAGGGRKILGEAMKKMHSEVRIISLTGAEPTVEVLPIPSMIVGTDKTGTVLVSHNLTGQMTVMRKQNGAWKPVPLDASVTRASTDQGDVNDLGFELAVSASGTTAILGTVDHRLLVFRIGETVERILELPHGKGINEVAVSPDGSFIALGDKDGTVRLIETATGKDVAAGLRHGSDSIRTVAFSSDGEWLLSAANDDKCRLWHTRTGRMASVPVAAKSDINKAVFSDDEKFVALAMADDEVRRVGIGIHSPAPPTWVADLLESIAGFRIGANGGREAIPVEQLHDWREKLSGLKDDSWWGRVAAGMVESDRRLMPQMDVRLSTLLATEAAKKLAAGDVTWAAFCATRARSFKPDISLSSDLERLAILNDIRDGEPVKLIETEHKPGEEKRTGSGIVLRWCPPGRILAGSPVTESGRTNNESQHHIIMPDGFWMSQTETTQGQWESVMGQKAADHARDLLREGTPFHLDAGDPNKVTTLLSFHSLKQPEDIDQWTGFFAPDQPMSFVTWDDAAAFCRRLTTREREGGTLPDGYVYRLPTAAEWEFACRAGTMTTTYAGQIESLGRSNSPTLNDIAWYSGNSSVDYTGTGWSSKSWPERAFAGDWAGPHEVARLKPNAWGLHDMLGNLSEWCIDASAGDDSIRHLYISPRLTSGTRHLIMGGSWRHHVGGLRAAFHQPEVENWCDHKTGFRVVLAPVSPEDAPPAEAPGAFYYRYNYEPDPGPRIWEPQGNGLWTESYPSGKQDRFMVLKETELLGRPGLQLRRQENVDGAWRNTTNIEVFFHLPASDTKSPGIFFRTLGGSGWEQWRRLGTITPGKP